MDNIKAPVPASQGELVDIDIFLFSNGEVFAPPRKYHLTAHELNYWDSTLDFLARAQYGYLQSSINLYTIDGKKVETPLELANNHTYVAVETKDTFLPGGYDQYLMKASKSWIKRYGSVSSSTTSKEKATTGTVLQSEITTRNGNLENITEMKEVKEVEENITEVKTTASINTEVKMSTNENPETIKVSANNNVQKAGDKKKPTPRSSTLRKNISNIHTYNDKTHLNTKEKPPTASTLKRRPGSPPGKNTLSKVIPPRKESLVKAPYSPGKPKLNSSQNVNKNSAVPEPDIDPDFIIPTKLSNIPETQNLHEPIGNETKNLKQDDDQVAKDVQYYEFIKQILYPLDDLLKRETSTREYPDNEARKNNTDTLETITENDGCYELTRNKKNNYNSAFMKSFSTEIEHGDVVKLRLSMEVTPGENTSNSGKSLPQMNDELWSIVIREKNNQVNMDEIVFQKDTMKSILDELQKNKPDQKYVVLRCDCCNNYNHQSAKLNIGETMNQPIIIKRIENNKDYVVLLPYTKPDDDILRCKCDEEIPKLDKIVQTSIVFQTTEYSKEASCKQTVDRATDAPRSSLDVKTISRPHSRVSLRDRACGTSEILFDNQVPPTPLPSKESRTVTEKCPAYFNTPNSPEVLCSPKICTTPPPPKDNTIGLTECLVCTNKPRASDMLNKSTQTNSYCFLLEARRQPDGHYSFHLPPLQFVKLYKY